MSSNIASKLQGKKGYNYRPPRQIIVHPLGDTGYGFTMDFSRIVVNLKEKVCYGCLRRPDGVIRILGLCEEEKDYWSRQGFQFADAPNPLVDYLENSDITYIP